MPTPQARTEIIIGKENVDLLVSKTVLIAGLGGVGGMATESIARSGIEKIIIIDHDVVSPSNLNRQILTLHSNIGEKKTEIMQKRLLDINPNLQLVVKDTFIRPETIGALLDELGEIDFILDCIDSIACKAALVKEAQVRNVPIISAMGAGNILDVSKVKIDKLKKTNGCPLAREMRRRLKKMRADLNYPVVFSNEERSQPLPHPPADEKTGATRAVNGTISYMPNLFGLMMSGYVINQLIGSFKILKKQ